MSANSSVLKEFLVKIGFKIDDTKYRDFQSAMKTTAKNAVEMSKTALAATTVMGAGLKAVAQQMESLYFATRRTGASATELKELGFAAEAVGVSAAEARGAVEGLAAARRTNPGLNGILGGLGIDPRQMDNAKVMVQLLTKLHSMPYYQAAQIAGLFGINEQTFAMLEQGLPEMQKYLALREKMFKMAGVTPDQVAGRSHEFNQQLRILEASLESLAEIIAYRLMPWGEKVIGWLQGMVGWLIKADSATGGWSSKILGIVSALAGGSIVKGGLGLLLKMLGRGGAGKAAAAAGEGAVEGEGVAAAAGGGILTITGGLVAAAIALAGVIFSRGLAEKVTGMLGLDPKGHQFVDGIKSMTAKVTDFAKNTLTPKVSGTLASFVAGFEGYRDHVYRDIAGNATTFFGHKLGPGESVAGQNPFSVLMSDIGKAAAAVRQLVKVKLSQGQENALDDFVFNVGAKKFASSTLLRKLNAGDYGGAENEFQRWNHALVDGHMTTVAALTKRRAAEAAMFRGDKTVSLTQKNEYHVNSTDPRGAASEIERRQKNMTADLVRNLSGAVQ